MLPRRFHLRPGEPLEAADPMSSLFKQASVAFIAVVILALVVAFAAEALALIAPSDALTFVP